MNQSVMPVIPMSVVVVVVLLMATAAVVAARPNGTAELDHQPTDAQRVIDAIPVADRAYFVTFHLAREAEQQGRNDVSVLPDFDRIPIDKHNMFKDIEVPDDFGRNLLDWVESEVLAERRTMWPAANGPNLLLWTDDTFKVCFPSGCVDPNEIGTSCCPF